MSCRPPAATKAVKKEVSMSSGEKARAKKDKALENKAKANPDLAAAKKEKNDACRERRKESGSVKPMG